MNTETDNEIDERFKKGFRKSHLGDYWQWTLCQYEWYGATNYISLQKDPGRYKGYRLVVETESGYSTPFIMGFYDADEVLRVIEGFPPTNPTFKTDRKKP